MPDNPVTPQAARDLRITVLYDNYPDKDGLETAWGFACVIQGLEKTILFDTGGDGRPLLANMKACWIEPEDIDILAISHQHWDHHGGIYNFLEKSQGVSLYVPASFSAIFKKDVQRYTCHLIDVKAPLKLCEHVYSTGDIDGTIREQALVLHTEKGIIVITGCAHPGIVKILKTAKEVVQDMIFFVLGGFHLMHDKSDSIEQVVSEFKQLGVRYAAPTHCSGDLARDMFKQAYQDKYLPIGAGTVINTKDLV
ncbi:MBL fold metallo-hydrolase [candidate division KSB3 bacterium]|uniref:MBL fold metallo-hydrolase n=1 Tax=candidate division KSB3 bacterium TaxID=2044937 RepID=A0A2G6KLA4_9BACT|nr:MAG: MBL fold metallo-hydrolase [candidate division KSB3 bacterium]